jgi:hypothetical protein
MVMDRDLLIRSLRMAVGFDSVTNIHVGDHRLGEICDAAAATIEWLQLRLAESVDRDELAREHWRAVLAEVERDSNRRMLDEMIRQLPSSTRPPCRVCAR